MSAPPSSSPAAGEPASSPRRAAEVLRHTALHVLELAVWRAFPGVEPAGGGVSPDAWWADFDLEETLSPADFPRIEEEARKILAADLPLERVELSTTEAATELRRQRSKLRAEFFTEGIAGGPVPFVRLGELFTPCAGEHLARTGQLGAFRLLSVSGAYFRDDETRPMLQRLYGAAFADPQALEEYLARREAAQLRDHRKLGPRLQLFAFLPEAPAMPFWLPRGVRVRSLLKGYLRRRYAEAGYQEIATPSLLPEAAWRTSGHWDHYRDRMFATAGEETQALRPMNCPGAILVYRLAERSWRDLPLRLAEMGQVHRNEKSGTLHGLLRAREFTQDDAHLFCAEESLEEEVAGIVRLVASVYSDLGFESWRAEISTRPPGALGSEADWARGEAALEAALTKAGVAHTVERGEGAFYGPKIDFHIADCLGREWQCGTIQVDFANPVRWDLTYAAPEGRSRRPVLIHRAILGSLERFLGILIEHTGGELPLWLAPEQARVLPVAEARHREAVTSVMSWLRHHGVRAEADLRPRPLASLVRAAEEELVPFILVVGDDEAAAGDVSVRVRGQGEIGRVALELLLSTYDWRGPLAEHPRVLEEQE